MDDIEWVDYEVSVDLPVLRKVAVMFRLSLAIRRGTLADVKRHATTRTMNATLPGNGSPLLLAYKRGRIDFIAFLLSCKPSVSDVMHIFHLAARDGQEGIMKLMLDCDTDDVFSRNGGRELTKALCLAVRSGRLGIVKILLDYGAKVDGKDNKNRTPLYYAYVKGDTNVIEALVDRGANIKIRVAGRKLVENQVKLGNLKMVKALLKQGLPDDYNDYDEYEDEDEDDYYDNSDGTALHMATTKAQAKMVQVLLKAGFDVDAENEEGTRPIHLALTDKHTKILDLLLEYGAEVDARDGNVESPLHIASQEYNLRAVRRLLEFGADVEVRDRKSTTVVGIGLRMMYLPLLEVLWDYTDDIDHLCCSTYNEEEGCMVRMTALEFCCSWRMMPVISALLERGANFEAQAYECCRRLKKDSTVEQLDQLPDVFEEHFIKLKTAKLTAIDAYKKHPAVPLTLTAVQRKNFQETCEAEVARMKEERIDDTGFTFYETFTRTAQLCGNQDVVEYFKSQNTEDLREQFPEYYRLLHVHFRNGLERKRLTDKFNAIFPVLFMADITTDLVDRVCRYLSVEDLTEFIETFSDLNTPERSKKTPMEFRPRHHRGSADVSY